MLNLLDVYLFTPELPKNTLCSEPQAFYKVKLRLGNPEQLYYYIFRANCQTGAVWQPRPHGYYTLAMATVAIHFTISPLFGRFGVGSQAH